MVGIQNLPVVHTVGAEPLSMPVDVLLAISEQAALAPAGRELFNVPGEVTRILRGEAGPPSGDWQRARAVMHPRVWAPWWSDEQLAAFLRAPLVRGEPPAEVPVAEVREAHPLFSAGGTPRRYDIVHYTGSVTSLWSGGANDWLLNLGGELRFRAGAVRDALVVMEARLLILHDSVGFGSGRDFTGAWEFARFLVGAGGPAVLVVGGTERGAANRYLQSFYAALTHNRILSEAVRDADQDAPGADVACFLGANGEDLLRFDGFAERVNNSIQRARYQVESAQTELAAAADEIERMRPYLPFPAAAATTDRLEALARERRELPRMIDASVRRMETVRRSQWDHETEGVIPVAEVARTAGRAEALAAETEALRREVRAAAEEAPRVLNANFSDAESSIMLGEKEVLVRGRAYDLLLDVGPRWDQATSIVRGNADFPERALPPTGGGWVLEVVVVSDDFEPRIAVERIWLPVRSGRSSPMVGGVRAEKPGPVPIRLSVPADHLGEVARARVSLYFESNLLQSAMAVVAVADAPGEAARPNSVAVDFVLSGTLRNLDALAERDLGRGEGAAGGRTPVALNLTLNGDGGGAHRIVVRPRIDERGAPAGGPPPHATPGVVPYDPDAAKAILDEARSELLNCFFERTPQGVDRSRGLDARNGKPMGAFQDDLVALARLGRRLFRYVTGQAESDDGAAAPVWTRQLRAALAERAVIQVARTGPANYVFPWALLYDYPLPGDRDPKFCPVVKEWAQGVRPDQHAQPHCPHRDRDFHQADIYCPFGFWGLQHVVEQPPSAARVREDGWRVVDLREEIRTGPLVDVGIGATRDARLKAQGLLDHWEKIRGIGSLRLLPSSPVGDVASVLPILEGSALVYFLCHGKFNAARNIPYLGIGPDEPRDAYQLYPDNIQEWANVRPAAANGDWLVRNPLVLINGCHTAQLEPGNILNFVTAFTYAGASGVLGTEIPVRLPLATEVAETLLGKLAGGMAVGEALRQVRWELANKGNLLGLAYTLYSLASLHIVREGAPE